MPDDQPPYPIIRRLIRDSALVLFFGAGASLVERQPLTNGTPATAPEHRWKTWLPTGGELRAYLASQVELDLSDQQNSFLELATVAQYYTSRVGRPFLYKDLHEIFAADYGFGIVHQLFAKTKAPLLILTTNYDEMIERAFTQTGKPFDLVIHQTNEDAHAGSVIFKAHGSTEPQYVAPNQVMIDLNQASVIYKMHGTVAHGPVDTESYVITEDDYVDFLIRMGSNTPIPAMIKEAFIDRHFLFLGYGLTDWNFRVMLGSLKEHLVKDRAWAIRFLAPRVEEKIWASRGVLMYDMKVEDFAERLGPI